jgi:tetratricopeptide (TPR) repeat protein
MEIPQNWDRTSLAFQNAIAAYNGGDRKLAGEICEAIIGGQPDHADAYSMLARVLLDNGHTALSRLSALYAMSLKPTAENVVVSAAAENHMGRPELAIQYLDEVLKRAPDHVVALRMKAEALLQIFKFDEAFAYAEKALALKPDEHPARIPRGYALLQMRRWGEGWDDFAYGVGTTDFRDKHHYYRKKGDKESLPDWDGRAPGRILVYAEQGLGDQIAYSSALVDTRVSEVVCDPKLTNLLQRSLPGKVYGDQFNKELEWDPKADYVIAMSQMMKYRRRTAESFPRTPYLKPHPEKRLMCKALLDSISSRPKVGIAWTGGKALAKSYGGRNLEPKDLGPLLSLPYDFVNLEYRDGDNIEGVHDLRWLHKTKDYDDTAALVDCLDAVVCVPTTAYHLAGALGVQAFVIVHDKPHFHEGVTGSESPWWGSVEFIRRSEMGTAKAIEQTARKLQVHIENLYRNRPEAAGSVQRAEMVHRAAGDEARIGGAADSSAVAHH